MFASLRPYDFGVLNGCSLGILVQVVKVKIRPNRKTLLVWTLSENNILKG